MEAISPLSMAGCTPHTGKVVCAVMHDGSYYYGKLSKVTEAGIYLDGHIQGTGGVSGLSDARARREIAQNVDKVKTDAFFSPFFFPFAALVFLFVLPFLFFPFGIKVV